MCVQILDEYYAFHNTLSYYTLNRRIGEIRSHFISLDSNLQEEYNKNTFVNNIQKNQPLHLKGNQQNTQKSLPPLLLQSKYVFLNLTQMTISFYFTHQTPPSNPQSKISATLEFKGIGFKTTCKLLTAQNSLIILIYKQHTQQLYFGSRHPITLCQKFLGANKQHINIVIENIRVYYQTQNMQCLHRFSLGYSAQTCSKCYKNE
eukprot:TRINITY_DN14084_c0_g1_i6.p1 TRINITY_DN14084_c0_g1~~TRINITY_DN14084_c0_g1_i6.p1  ORF type:complete len:204 (+),score=-15.11 TRINITY_DN14084_c0_g1_i6:201-812(+)